jgi:MFS family permease
MALYVGIGIFYVFYGTLNYDEGYDLYAGHLVYTGKIPYIDFMYNHGPLMAYIYGIPQILFGQSLYVGRFTSLFFGVLMLVFTTKVAEKFGGKKAAIVMLALVAFNPYAIYLFSYAKSYVLATFFIMLSLYVLFCKDNLGKPTKYMLAIFIMSLGVGVRTAPLLLISILLTLYVIILHRKDLRTITMSVGAITLTLGAMLGPFLLVNSEVTMFDLFLFYTGGNIYDTTYDKVNNIFMIMNNFIVAAALFLIGLIMLLLYRKRHGHEIKFLFVISLIAFTAMLIPRETLPEYPIILFPIVAVLASYVFSNLYTHFKSRFIRYGLVSLIGSAILFMFFLHGFPWVDTSVNLPIEEVDEMAGYVRESTQEDGRLLTFSTYLAVQSHREVVPGLSQAYYSYRPDWSDEKARKFNALNNNLLNQCIERKCADAVILTDFERAIIGNKSVRLIEENYNLVKTMPYWGQHRNTAYLYLPNNIDLSVQETSLQHGDTQTWNARGLPQNAGYVVTIRWGGSALVVQSGNTNESGEARGSFMVGNNIPQGATALRVELTSNPLIFKETLFTVGELTDSPIVLEVQKSHATYGDTQTWNARGLPQNAGYVVTIRWGGSALVVQSGNTNESGEARGSFMVGNNIPQGETTLRIELLLLPSYYKETVFNVG